MLWPLKTGEYLSNNSNKSSEAALQRVASGNGQCSVSCCRVKITLNHISRSFFFSHFLSEALKQNNPYIVEAAGPSTRICHQCDTVPVSTTRRVVTNIQTGQLPQRRADLPRHRLYLRSSSSLSSTSTHSSLSSPLSSALNPECWNILSFNRFIIILMLQRRSI